MGESRYNRRDFLQGRAAAGVVRDAVDAWLDTRLDPVDPPGVARSHHIVTLGRRAMACQFEVRISASKRDNPTEAGLAALDAVDRAEDRLTIYREWSDLIELNRSAAQREATVDAELFSLLELCGRIHDETDGAFDPTTGPLSRVWGFHRREGRLPSDAERLSALAQVGWGHVQLDRQNQTVRFQRDGLEINANSIGKGHALDSAAEALAAHGVADSLMHGGRSTLLARGDNHALARGGWRAGLRDPLDPQRHLAVFTLRNQALSTSGSGTQFFEHEGRRYGHLIDPRTGWPADGLYSATVSADTAAEADALSTAAYTLGVDGVARLCQRRPDVRALLVAPGAEAGVTTHAFNWPEEEWRPSASGV